MQDSGELGAKNAAMLWRVAELPRLSIACQPRDDVIESRRSQSHDSPWLSYV
jgi:hypothetical protein